MTEDFIPPELDPTPPASIACCAIFSILAWAGLFGAVVLFVALLALNLLKL